MRFDLPIPTFDGSRSRTMGARESLWELTCTLMSVILPTIASAT